MSHEMLLLESAYLPGEHWVQDCASGVSEYSPGGHTMHDLPPISYEPIGHICIVGFDVGVDVGNNEGLAVGRVVGIAVGFTVGDSVGPGDGETVGFGAEFGAAVGFRVGGCDGCTEGYTVGSCDGIPATTITIFPF